MVVKVSDRPVSAATYDDGPNSGGTQTSLVPPSTGSVTREALRDRSDWQKMIDHAHINHEHQPWEVFNNGRFQPDEDRAYELLTSWTTHFLSATDHAYRWGGFDG